MPSARELLAQADALMRRNRAGMIDTEIPELKDIAMVAPVPAAAPVALDDVPELTEAVEEIVRNHPAWGQVNAEQLWGNCHADVIKNGMTPAAAVDKAFKRAEAIFAKFTFG